MGVATDTILLIGILIFYGLMSIVIPVINLEYNTNIIELDLSWSGFDFIISSATLLYYSIADLPLWLTFILALPSIIGFVLIYKLIRGTAS